MSKATLAGRRSLDLVALLFVVVLFGVLCLRAALPNNRLRPGTDFLRLDSAGVPYYLPRGTNNFDDVVTQVTAHHFQHDGFWRTHFLPNRGGMQISLGDRSQTQCEPLYAVGRPPAYKNAFGQPIANPSLNNDCIYVHYPPLADWVFGAMAALGLDRVLHYKILALLLNSGFLLLTYIWLRGQVRQVAALAALFVAGSLPAFLRWADALFFHSFHYLFLVGVVVSWERFLKDGRRRHFLAAWALYLCLALVSHQLTVCCAIVMTGLFFVRRGLSRQTARACVGPLLLQFAAPVVAFATLVGLSVSLLGTTKTWDNLTITMSARMVQGSLLGGVRGGMALLLQWIAADLVSWGGVLLAVALLVFAHRALGRPGRRALAILGTFFAGGVSFWVLFLGTTSEHFWMMYRQIMPFMILLVAMVADALIEAVEELQRRRAAVQPEVPTRTWRQVFLSAPRATAVAVLGCAFVGWVGQRNVRYVVDDVRWNWRAQRLVNPGNLVRARLDVVQWKEDETSDLQGIRDLPVSGLRVQEPPRWMVDLRMKGPGRSHYEVWWLDEQVLGSVHLLVDAKQIETVTEHCFLSYFDGNDFRRFPDSSNRTVETFTPEADVPNVPYSWLRFSLPSPVRMRATRLTCAGMDEVTLRQIEAYSS